MQWPTKRERVSILLWVLAFYVAAAFVITR